LKSVSKEIRSFEDPALKSTAAGKRAKKELIAVEREILSIRQELMEIRRNRVATGEKKAL
jgi:hypothetical protein